MRCPSPAAAADADRRYRRSLSSGIGDDDGHLVGGGQLPFADALPNHRVALGGIGADQEEAVGGFDVDVSAWRPVRSQRARVAGSGRGHAEPRVRVEVVGAEKPLGELGGDVVLLGEELA